ncbi:MAG: DNA repair protein RadC [Clostridia bacterium]|nr:DNA repair protein RadC [Clostridia bacterium]
MAQKKNGFPDSVSEAEKRYMESIDTDDAAEKGTESDVLREEEAHFETPAAVDHSGHRHRLRQRFIDENGFDSFQDHELLELLLYYGRLRGDTNGTAHELINTFGSLLKVFEAHPDQLRKVSGVGEETAVLISMVLPLTKAYNRMSMRDPKRISNRADAQLFCRSLSQGARMESFYVICLDAGCRLLGTKKISEGSLSEVSAYPRKVVSAALDLNAHSVILSHNHPGGTAGPSAEDISTTKQLQKLLGALGILVLDHIIVAGSSAYSMAQNGDIVYSR